MHEGQNLSTDKGIAFVKVNGFSKYLYFGEALFFNIKFHKYLEFSSMC